ncbi:MAG: hypothetical protein ACD_81C00119G0001 [uncultured bacterium]|uniref:Uncharacterized protein n=2 Tax=Candidatus Wolfeibacteriota TaxID=1752735 RepID=A0A0G1H8C1_9BACT|nr:MAG: hypothetical protein ACD_81C00119G0001 [uncultured bacterium]KKR13063.1 MAG: hypothetical protein UT41_C0001G0607 [Candidatus Wolfebacteria bacterium GW2011_GWC2_39_22]KKT42733.1 MAG: hypothetical protein UW32_C0004G0038 [Candidatus Wolfebacteria bacterium GW2011_GWE2_44_13]HBI26064.1 hypothetical protein [Candidatus Wolfebacteria bacterium]
MSYWDATDRVLRENGGKGPPCGFCGREKFPIDDHGRFGCFCTGANIGGEFGMRSAAQIPQVDVSTMSDEEKALIPPIHRLDAPPTEAEAKILDALLRGPEEVQCRFNADTYDLPCAKE